MYVFLSTYTDVSSLGVSDLGNAALVLASKPYAELSRGSDDPVKPVGVMTIFQVASLRPQQRSGEGS